MKWSGVALVLGGLAVGFSCQDFPGPVASARIFPFDARVQEGEVTLRDGDEAVVRYKTVYQAPPRLVIVEFKQSWFKDKPYSKSDFQIVQQDAAGFKMVNNHPEAGLGAVATIRWRAEGVPAAEQPPPPSPLAPLAPNARATPEQLVAAVKALGGTVNTSTPSPTQPVVNIDLHHTRVTDANLEALRGFTTLRVLNLAGTGITDAGLKHLKDLSLETLDVGDTDVTDRGLKEIAAIKTLTGLDLWDAGDGGRA